MSPMGVAAAAVVLLGVLILVHELGHFVFAKLFHVKVLRFSLGFGPRIVGVTFGETEYRLSAIPLGGYVRLLGEDPGDPIPPIDRPRALAAKPLWQRYAVVVAGPVFNLLLALLIYFIHFAGQRTLLPPIIGTVLPDLPAATAGLLPGDRVESVDGHRIRYWEELEHSISTSAGKTLRFAIRRGPTWRSATSRRSSSSASGPFRRKRARGLIGVSPRFHLPEIGVLDPSSPAAQAGLQDLRLHHRGQRRARSAPGPIRAGGRARRRLAAAPQLPARRLLGGAVRAHRDRGARLSGGDPGGRVRRRRAPPLRDRHPVGRAVRVLRRARQPRRPDRPAARRPDRIDRRRAAGALGRAEGEDGQPSRQRLPLGWMSGAGARREASFRQEIRPQLDVNRQEEQRPVFGALNRPAWKTEAPVPITNRFTYSVGHGFKHTAEIIATMVYGFGEIVRGRVPLTELGSPLMIGYAAGVAAEQGLDQYLWLMAVISINLGLLNFLPVPILDGGLLVFFTLELFKRRPPSPRARRDRHQRRTGRGGDADGARAAQRRGTLPVAVACNR